MVKKSTKTTTQLHICDYCINYILKDIKTTSEKLTVGDIELINLFHKSSPSIRQSILLLLKNLQNDNCLRK